MEENYERSLLKRIRDGDTGAFDEIFDEYRPRLFGFLVRMCRDRDIAEDLLQETWLRFAKNARGLSDDSHLAAWLFTVAHNLFISFRRSRLLDELRMQELTRLHHEPLGGSPFEAAASSELERRIEHALARLPAPYREALLLVGVEGLSPSEAASVCDLNPEAFRKRLSRAREMLARAIRPPQREFAAAR